MRAVLVPTLWRAALALGLLVGLGVSAAEAQTKGGTPWEFSVSGTWVRGYGLPAITGNETEPTGGQLPLFTAQSALDGAPGVEGTLSRHLTGLVSAEAEGTWSRVTYRTTVLSDFESATLTTATNAANAYSVSGAIVVTFARHARLQPFVRAGYGWRRELSEDQTTNADGRLVVLGGGVKYWWGSRGSAAHVGLRADVGAVGRSGSLTDLGTTTLHFSPAASAGLTLRF